MGSIIQKDKDGIGKASVKFEALTRTLPLLAESLGKDPEDLRDILISRGVRINKSTSKKWSLMMKWGGDGKDASNWNNGFMMSKTALDSVTNHCETVTKAIAALLLYTYPELGNVSEGSNLYEKVYSKWVSKWDACGLPEAYHEDGEEVINKCRNLLKNMSNTFKEEEIPDHSWIDENKKHSKNAERIWKKFPCLPPPKNLKRSREEIPLSPPPKKFEEESGGEGEGEVGRNRVESFLHYLMTTYRPKKMPA